LTRRLRKSDHPKTMTHPRPNRTFHKEKAASRVSSNRTAYNAEELFIKSTDYWSNVDEIAPGWPRIAKFKTHLG